MTKQGEPIIEKATGEDFTRVTFKPDLKRFGMQELDDDIISLMCRRAFDVAGTTRGVKVFLNDIQIPVTLLFLKIKIFFYSVKVSNNTLIDILKIVKMIPGNR